MNRKSNKSNSMRVHPLSCTSDGTPRKNTPHPHPEGGGAQRFGGLSEDALTADQRRVWDNILSGPRDKVEEPHKVWLYSPAFADIAQQLGSYARHASLLPPRLSELAILITGRQWESQYEWVVHKKIALNAGVRPEVIDALIQGYSPATFKDLHEEAVFKFSIELYKTKFVSDSTFELAVQALGRSGVVDLIGILGYYTMISMTLNVFNITAPAGSTKDF